MQMIVMLGKHLPFDDRAVFLLQILDAFFDGYEYAKYFIKHCENIFCYFYHFLLIIGICFSIINDKFLKSEAVNVFSSPWNPALKTIWVESFMKVFMMLMMLFDDHDMDYSHSQHILNNVFVFIT